MQQGDAGSLNSIFARNPNALVVSIAEIDPRRTAQTLARVTDIQGSAPKVTTDFRKLIEDDSIDALCDDPDKIH